MSKNTLLLCCYGRAGFEILNLILLRNNYNYGNLIVFTHKEKNDILIEFLKSQKINFYTSSINKNIEIVKNKKGFLLSIHYRHIIKKEILDAFEGRKVNLHPSLLPNYRGCFSSVWAIINNEKETGITYHECVEGVDTGNILIQEKIKISSDETGYSLFHKLITLSLLNLDKLFLLIENNYFGVQQSKEGSYYKREIPFNNTIQKEWNEEFKERYIRALYYPPFSPPEVSESN